MVLPDGRVKVTDFGLAKSLSADVGATAGRLLGTPTYMSPEQVRGRPVDERTDIYLLGLTAWFLFTGKPPFASDQVGEVIDDQLNSPLPDLESVRPDLSPALGKAIGRMCAKDPAERPASMGEISALCAGLRPSAIHPAPIIARGAAVCADWAILFVLLAIAFVATGLVVYGPARFAETQHLLGSVLAQILVTAFCIAGLTLSEYGLGASPGMMLFGMGVVRADGTAPSYRQILLRFLVRFPVVLDCTPSHGYAAVSIAFWTLQWVAIGGGVVCYFFASGRTLSDLLTRTRVVFRLREGSRILP
jgi:uncharacterized RDD family membrane protein YckC